MIRMLKLKNFKCFQSQDILFRPMTLLTGVNSAGKSTVIQSLLLLQQNLFEINSKNHVTTSGDLVNIGMPNDMLNSNVDDDSVSITVITEEKSFDLCATVHNNTVTKSVISNNSSKFLKFFYLNAERISPRTLFPIPTAMQQMCNPIGKHGEFAAYILHTHGSKDISCADASTHNLLSANAAGSSTSLQMQTEAWLTALGVPIQIQTERPSGSDAIVLRFCFPGASNVYYRPTNVGFGLTYALPIIVAALHAPVGSLLIVENPEAHLHPKGQAIIGKFLACAAACGIQVVIETHSDHILNGIRVAVKHEYIDKNDVQINFFTYCDAKSNVTCPQIDADGHIDQWPKDFFDEWDRQLFDLL